MKDAKVISVETIPKRPFVSWEEITQVPILADFPLSTRWVHYCTKIHSHWAVQALYFCGIWEGVLVSALAIDLAIIVAKCLVIAICWIGKQLWQLIKHGYKWLMDIAGESIKAFLKSLLKWLGIALAAYLVYVFIKSGWYVTAMDLIFGR